MDLDVCVPKFTISLVSEAPRVEVFAVNLKDISLRKARSGRDRESLLVDLGRLQVDLRYPTPKVMLASFPGDKFLHLNLIRAECLARDLKILSATVRFSQVELFATDELVGQARLFAENAAPRSIGLDVNTVLARAGVPYNLSCGGPPPASMKFVLSNMSVSEISVRVFCRLDLALLPRWLTAVF